MFAPVCLQLLKAETDLKEYLAFLKELQNLTFSFALFSVFVSLLFPAFIVLSDGIGTSVQRLLPPLLSLQYFLVQRLRDVGRWCWHPQRCFGFTIINRAPGRFRRSPVFVIEREMSEADCRALRPACACCTQPEASGYKVCISARGSVCLCVEDQRECLFLLSSTELRRCDLMKLP